LKNQILTPVKDRIEVAIIPDATSIAEQPQLRPHGITMSEMGD
jgi:hypothetical protein